VCRAVGAQLERGVRATLNKVNHARMYSVMYG
jgi:hypothetical protein